jgi:hypothetical protein
MSFRTTAILFGIVFLLGIGLLILSFSEDDTTPTKELLLSHLAGAKAEEIDTIEIEKVSARLVLKRVDKDHWNITEPVSARADAGTVDRVVSSLLGVRATSYPELSANPAMHGLEPPSLRVTLRSGEKSDTLNIGEVTIGGSKAVGFVTTPERKRPMAVSRTDLEPLFKQSQSGSAGELAKWTNDYRTKQVFDVDPRSGADDITSVKLTNKGKDLALAKSPGGTWQFTTPAGWGDAATSGESSAGSSSTITGVRGLINSLVNLQASAADDFIDNPKDLKEYGLNADNPNLIRVELKDKGGKTEIALLGKVQEPAPPAAPGAPAPPAPPAKLYVKREGSNTIVRVNPPATLDGLYGVIANPDPLRDRDLVRDTDKSRIDAIDITVGGQVTKLRKAGGPFGTWKLYGGPNDPQDANAEVVNRLLNLVAQPHNIKDFPPVNDANFTPQETKAEVKLWTDAVKPNTDPKVDKNAEPKVEGPPVVLQFGKKDAEGIYVRRTNAAGQKADFRLPEKVKVAGAAPPPSPFGPTPPAGASEDVEVASAVAKTRLDFLDTTLKSFSQFQANKLTIQNGPNVTEVVKEKPPENAPLGDSKWKYVKPDASKDRTADSGSVSDLLTMLSTESIVKFIAENPPEAELAKWALDPKNPKLKVTVGLDAGPAPAAGDKEKEKDKERVYYFGNETDDKQFVYARQEGKAAVFTVRKLTADKFATADLRDKTVVRFDKSKVKKLSFKGWKEKTGFEVELIFEKKDGNWTVSKSPGAYMLDPAKVDKFLDAANNLRAKSFIPGPAKPEQKLTPADGALQVFVELEGAPLFTFTVGGPTDGDASYFLQTSLLPANENIVTVVSDVFKPYKDNSAAFAK